jgi:ATP-dependent DNA helicase RecG
MLHWRAWMNSLETPLAELSWVGHAKARLLGRLGLMTWRDLLEHYPRRHEDRTRFEQFPTGGMERQVCLRGIIQKVSARYFGRKRIVEATLLDPEGALGGRLICRWFNLFYIQRLLAEGQEMVVYGRPKESKNRVFMDHPEFETIEEDDTGKNWIHMDRIVPVYPLTEGVRQRPLREMIFTAIEELVGLPQTPRLPGENSPAYSDAIREIHFPSDGESYEEARQVLALAELVRMQIVIGQRRRTVSGLPGAVHFKRDKLCQKFLGSLPFTPTGAQQRTLKEIQNDLAQARPMNRLLQGDVGSGKTLVAVAAICLVKEAGYQSAFLAPTQVLAEQHYQTLEEWLRPMGVRLFLRTGARQDATFLELEGKADVIVGTHALLYDDYFDRLGLVVVDEQHKFGVTQRGALLRRVPVPDLLVMTATPIPRTLAMTVYGDLDVSVLDEKPANRRPVITRLRSTAKLPEAASFIRERLATGRQAFIIYPVIDESDSLALKAATTEFARWQELLKPATCGLLHGRLSHQEKERTMQEFREKRLSALVSTTVVEVGVDVPNATVMLIENSERFGLAQLHQLRGRIGRSEHQGYCVLLSDRDDPDTREKLRVLEETDDGFEIAEADLRLRGPGDLLGTRQSGLPPLRLADLIKDGKLVQQSKRIAEQVLKRDPDLLEPENKVFRRAVDESKKNGTCLVG